MLTIRDNRIVVNDIAMGSPADQSGININDHIISVNKKAAADLTLMAVKELLGRPTRQHGRYRGPDPRRNEHAHRFACPGNAAQVPSVVAFMWQDTQYGYLKINSFTDTTVQDVDDALAKLSKAGMKGLILDLRDNGGGDFRKRHRHGSAFSRHRHHHVAHSTRIRARTWSIYAKNPNALAMPLVVLVDGDTASAAEVLAGALKDNNRAYLIGQTTYGKGCTQTLLKTPRSRRQRPDRRLARHRGPLLFAERCRLFRPRRGSAFHHRGTRNPLPSNDDGPSVYRQGNSRTQSHDEIVVPVSQRTAQR